MLRIFFDMVACECLVLSPSSWVTNFNAFPPIETQYNMDQEMKISETI